MTEETTKRRSEIERRVLEKVGEFITTVGEAKVADEVIASLHSVAVLFFPIDPSLFSGSISERYRDQVCSVEVPSAAEADEWLHAFYLGTAFRTLARVLLVDVASNWLPCFSISVQRHLYDVFFLDGLATEVVQILVPFLQQNGGDGVSVNVVQTNAERLLVLCLLENKGVLQIARELSLSYKLEDPSNRIFKLTISNVAQSITSVPDKARLKAPPLLSSHIFFKKIITQLIWALDEQASTSKENSLDSALLLAGEVFSRICRRGYSDLLLGEVTPHILNHVRSLLSASNDSVDVEVFKKDSASRIWCKMMEAVTDSFAIERMSEQLLRGLAIKHANDIEAYWTLWIFFNRIIKQQTSVRSMFVDKFLLWKLFPLCCLRWILQFSVLECQPPYTDSLAKGDDTRELLQTVQRLASVWSKREFVQSIPVEQQAYVTAALGLCLDKMSREELDKTTEAMHSILQGVSYRLESPEHLTRRMASSIALVFSKVIDPKNLLYLDESCKEDTIDWTFGLETKEKDALSISNSLEKVADGTTVTLPPVKDLGHKADDKFEAKKMAKMKNLSEFKLVDPDEIVDLATLQCRTDSDEDGGDENASVDSDSSCDSSLQPYDLVDDDTDLKRRFTQLVDVIGALRKTDDPDGVENAIDVAERLVRASPDELTHMAGDLARTLIQVRCSDVAVEGGEDSMEEKRQRALIALLVTCPFESLETLNSLLFSPNLDISQRLMILDVMTEAARELANSKTMKPKHQAKGPLISVFSDPQPWFLPSNEGPSGAGQWKETSETGPFLLSWSNRYERDLPSKPGQIARGRTRRWGLRSANKDQNQMEWSHNQFPVYAAAFMLPAMNGFDKKRHGVDLLGRDFIVLGKLIHMLGVCITCAAMHPEASALATSLLDLLQRREVYNHKEGYVRRAVLYAASCILTSLHPSYIVTALAEGNLELSRSLDWVRTWALHVADLDTDKDCYLMAMSCLQQHAEMTLGVSRAMESTEVGKMPLKIGVGSNMSKSPDIKIPFSNLQF